MRSIPIGLRALGGALRQMLIKHPTDPIVPTTAKNKGSSSLSGLRRSGGVAEIRRRRDAASTTPNTADCCHWRGAWRYREAPKAGKAMKTCVKRARQPTSQLSTRSIDFSVRRLAGWTAPSARPEASLSLIY